MRDELETTRRAAGLAHAGLLEAHHELRALRAVAANAANTQKGCAAAADTTRAPPPRFGLDELLLEGEDRPTGGRGRRRLNDKASRVLITKRGVYPFWWEWCCRVFVNVYYTLLSFAGDRTRHVQRFRNHNLNQELTLAAISGGIPRRFQELFGSAEFQVSGSGTCARQGARQGSASRGESLHREGTHHAPLLVRSAPRQLRSLCSSSARRGSWSRASRDHFGQEHDRQVGDCRCRHLTVYVRHER